MSLDLIRALGSMRRIVATRSLDFDRTLGAELGTEETKFEGLSRAWVVSHLAFVAAVETKSVDLNRTWVADHQFSEAVVVTKFAGLSLA